MISGNWISFVIFSIIGAFLGGFFGTFIPLMNNSYADLIWSIPIGVLIGGIIPFIIYIGLLVAYIFTS